MSNSLEMMNANNSKWSASISREKELYPRKNDIRSEFGRDYTRILHCQAYRRLKHKTQVFFNTKNDHICTRMEHVAHVESVSYTIANALNLNTELTKAISMGHDLGHAPFGHEGETIINELSIKYMNTPFWHEKNGLRVVESLELLEDDKLYLDNLDLTYAVRDGILCHCGEIDENSIFPRDEKIELDSMTKENRQQPYTWEGCVVKISDKIAYLGRDIEDALTLKIIDLSDTKELFRLGMKHGHSAVNTSVIIHEFITDIVNNSSLESGIAFSAESLEFINAVKKFNYEKIYNNHKLRYYREYSKLVIESIFYELYNAYSGSDTIYKLCSLKKYSTTNSLLKQDFIRWLCKYCDNSIVPFEKGNKDKLGFERIDVELNETRKMNNKKIYGKLEEPKEYISAIIDFISGMTDSYAIKCFEELIAF